MMFEKIKHFVITFRASILSVFISLFVVIIGILIFITSYRFSIAVSYTAFGLMEKASHSVFEKVTGQMQRATMLSELSADLIESSMIDQSNLDHIAQYTYHVMNQETKQNSSIEGAYWADEKGDFVWSQRLKDGTIKSEITDRRHAYPKDTSYYYDKTGKVIRTVESQKSSDLNYDAHLRPWYLDAKKFGSTSWTEVYRYYDSDLLGMSVLTPGIGMDGLAKGVFGIDIQVDFLQKFLETLKVSKNGLVFIANEKSQLVALPGITSHQNAALLGIDQIHMPWVISSFHQYKKSNQEQFEFEWDHKSYLAFYKRIPRASTTDLIIGVVAPRSDFLGDLYRINMIILGFCAVLFLLGIFLISKFTSKIVKPLSSLTDEIIKIKNFELEGDIHIPSHIKEVVSISQNVQSMKEGLRSFQKYVPAALVRQLIQSGEAARIEGVKKNLVIFFSDIVGFTSLAEREDPAQLTQHLCDYFSELSHIIAEEKGTIDKYIGDAIMAFWGAPVELDQAHVHAARAALRCKKRLNELNQNWKQSGIPMLQTKIGLHMGVAIVGNIGSQDRINYTIIGDSVNHANRLEDINRKYGTEIMVSAALYDALKDQFVLRHVDRVSVKGRTEVEDIYELIAQDRSELTFDLDLYSKHFQEGFSCYLNKDWQAAVGFFQKCISLYPQDTVAPVFIDRCHQSSKN